MPTTSTFHRAPLRLPAEEAEVLREWGHWSRARGDPSGTDAALRTRPYRPREGPSIAASLTHPSLPGGTACSLSVAADAQDAQDASWC